LVNLTERMQHVKAEMENPRFHLLFNMRFNLAKPNLAKPSLAKPSLAKPSLAKPSLAKPSLAKPSLGKPDLNSWPSLALS
jgi:hypothetical protein